MVVNMPPSLSAHEPIEVSSAGRSGLAPSTRFQDHADIARSPRSRSTRA
jgi:hypothetical protein